MKLFQAFIAAILVSCAVLARAAADPPAVVGRLSYISGAVSFAPGEANEDWRAATLNRPLTTGDRLWTDAGGRAELHAGSLAVRMDALTSVDVLNLDDRGLQLRLAQGNVNLRVRHTANGQPAEIATPAGAVVLTQPGSYRVSVDPQGAVTAVAARAGGQAEVFAAHGSFLVSDGQQATMTSARQDLAAAPAPDEFDRWARTRDQREEQVAATRYVPSEMTGYEDLDEYGSWRTVPEYGAVWQPTTVPAGWAPYRYGHWVWISPWGWTWVDDAPWGFAPSHYGRWVWLGNHWAWAPGRIVARPVYAPAMVAFLGGPNFSVSIGAGSAPAVGWVPLGWREPYRPWYHASPEHVRNVNITQVTNITNVTHIRYVNRSAPSGVTVVSRENFVAARPVQPAALRVSQRTLAAAPVTAGSPVATPSAASLAQARSGARPPAEVRNREAMAVSAPPVPGSRDPTRGARFAAEQERPRVRVIARQERVNPAQADGQRAAADKAAPSGPQGAPAGAREQAAAEKAAEQSPARRAEQRRAPAPPVEVTARPTFDRAERPQAVPQPQTRSPAQDGQRGAQQTERGEQQRQLAQQDRQREADREQQAQRQADVRRQEEQRNAQQRQLAQQHTPPQQRAEQQPQQRAEQQGQQRAQEQARQQQQAQQQAQQRAQQHAQQQQAQQQAQRRAEEQTRQQQAQQRVEQPAQQRAQEQARQQQQAQQRAQQQARAEQPAQQRAQQHAQQQAQQQQAQQRAQQQAQQQHDKRRVQESQEKAGRERPRGDKGEKGEKG